VLHLLVTSTARRRLLQLLWGEWLKGSATELAQRAGVNFSTAYRELRAMRAYQVVRSSFEGGREVYARNDAHPDADLLRRLVASRPAPPAPRDADAEDLRRRLRALGVPLAGDAAREVPEVERTLVEGVRLARRDPVLARALPLAFWLQRTRTDPERLREQAQAQGAKQAVGFYLALTAQLGRDATLRRLANTFRDHRVKSQRFFETPPSKHTEALERERTPALARKWGFTMNLDQASFASTFEKFAHA
jgi:hypothetical protein